jgi:hypothetical protein
MALSDPPKAFPDGDRAPKGKAKSKGKADDFARLEQFAATLEAPEEGGEGFAARAPEQVEAQAREAGLDPAKIAVIMQLVTEYGPKVMGGVTKLIALFKTKK